MQILNDALQVFTCFSFAWRESEVNKQTNKSIDEGLHGVYKTPLRASFPANKDPTVDSPVLFSALRQLHSPFPWRRPTWAHLGLWPWKHILKDKREVVNVHNRHEHEGIMSRGHVSCTIKTSSHLLFVHSVDTKLWTNKFILKKIDSFVTYRSCG